MLSISNVARKNKFHAVARATAALTSPNHPTAVFYRSEIADNARERDELTQQAALINPNRPSAAKTEAARRALHASESLAHTHFIDIPMYIMMRNTTEEVASCGKIYAAEIVKVRQFCHEFLRGTKLDEGKVVDEDALRKEVETYMQNLHYKWNLEAAHVYWASLKIRLSIQQAQALLAVQSNPPTAAPAADTLEAYFTKHIVAAQGYYRSWMQGKEPDLSHEALDERTRQDFELLKQNMLKDQNDIKDNHDAKE